jgi:hypothetical protein
LYVHIGNFYADMQFLYHYENGAESGRCVKKNAARGRRFSAGEAWR